MGLPNSSRLIPEGSPPNLPALLPSSTLPEAVSLLLLPEALELLSESRVESKFAESLNPLAFCTFFMPDKDVDGDPHFMIHIPRSEERICYTLGGRPGDLLQLIDDPKAGLHVRGQLLGAPSRPGHKDQIRIYFQIITLTADKPQAYTVTITRSSISVRGEGTLFLSWDQPVLLRRPQLELHVAAAACLTLCLGPHLKFLVLWHCYRNPSTLQLPNLGFCVVSGSGLSPSAHSLLGQFQHADIQLVAGPMGAPRPRYACGPRQEAAEGITEAAAPLGFLLAGKMLSCTAAAGPPLPCLCHVMAPESQSQET
ncbi:inter-alpha-trypsin inhibitor heavy chain H2-like protein [Camelus ferus]|nr:inter-alpha-trypsin inhibitor heavy chain H2-like protein [Camelus ferus]